MNLVQFISAGLTAGLLVAAEAVAAFDAPVADAAEKKEAAAIRALLERKADVNASQPDGTTALHWAAHHDDLETLKLLLAAGADPKSTNRYRVTPLTLACTSGNTAIVEALLQAGADPNTTGAGGETVLMTASRTGRLGPVQALLARGADVNAREQNHQTAMMWAAADGHVEVVNALLQHEADFRTPLKSGFTPFFFAVREGRGDVVQRLIQAGAIVNEVMRPEDNDDPPTTPLILAIENGHFELAAALLDAGARPNEQPAGFAALHALVAARKPIRGDGNPPPIGSGNLTSLELVRRIIKHGGDINERIEDGLPEFGRFTTTGATPFFLAARHSDVPLMRLLVELGADAQLPNRENCTPLLAAAGVGALDNGHEAAGTEEEAIEAVRLLLDRGTDVNAVDDNGETVMHGAAYQGRSKLVSILTERGADIKIWNRKNKDGWTPLMIAQGHRPGNFRPAPETIVTLEHAMRAAGITPPKATRDAREPGY